MSAGGSVRMKRSSDRRRYARRKKLCRRLLLCTLTPLLVLIGVYFLSQYRLHMDYAKYPLKHKELIVSTAGEFGLEPWHVAAVVRCESGFWEGAVSSVGARGLMQIMPETGEWLAGKFDEEDSFDEDDLFDPATNLKYGCWYLSWLMDRFDGDVTVVTAAFHAGQGKVDSWLEKPEYSPDGKTLSYIPFESTAKYVKNVLKACEKYQKLYDFTEGAEAA